MLPQAQGDYSIFRLSRKGLILAERMKHIRPDYVARFEDATHVVALIHGDWYLYEKIPRGRSHKYIGRIREDGIYPGKHQEHFEVEEPVTPIVLDSLNIKTYEFGFSKAVLDLCPDSWKNLVGARWKDVLIEIIIGQSPHSYLKQNRGGAQIRQQIGNHRRSLQKYIGISLDELWIMLGNVCWIQGSDLNGFSLLSDQQKDFCREHHIRLEVIS